MSLKRTFAALGVALLVVTAGCSGVLNDDGPATTTGSDEDATTASTATTEQTDLSEASLPAGVTEAGLENVSALLEAHNRSLDGAAYSVEVDIDGDGQQTSVAMTRGADAARLRVETGDTTVHGWKQGPRTATVQSTDGETQYRYAYGDSENSVGSGFQMYSGVTDVVIGTYLTAGDFNTSGVVTRDGTTLVKLTADRANQTAVEQLGSGNTTVESFEATALVDENGVVHGLEADLTETVDGETRTGTVSYELTDLGSATPEEPNWLGEVPQLDATVTDEGFVAVEHAGGPTVENGTQLSVIADDTFDSVTIPEDVSAGGTVYLYVDEEGGQNEVRASVGEKPSSDEVAVDLSTAEQVTISGSLGNVSVTLSPSA